MNRVMFLLACFCMLVVGASYAREVDYSSCESIQDVIARETQEIANTHPAEYDELAELYVSRGESYLLSAQYEKAVDDFQNANSLLGRSQNIETALIVAFRAAFGEVVSYDNLGMQEDTERAIQQLQIIVGHVGGNCLERQPFQETASRSTNKPHFRNMTRPTVNSLHFRDMIVACKDKRTKQENQPQARNNYDDILGPSQPPEPGWCEEIMTGVARVMEVIALQAPSPAIKVTLVGAVEVLLVRGLKCCQTGEFWKACVAPITRKWQSWKNNKENHIPPNKQNLPLYVNEGGV